MAAAAVTGGVEGVPPAASSPAATAASAGPVAAASAAAFKADGAAFAGAGAQGALGVSSPPPVSSAGTVTTAVPGGVSPGGQSPGSGSSSGGVNARSFAAAAGVPAAPTPATASGGEAAAAEGGAEEEARASLSSRLKDLLESKRGIKAKLKGFDMDFFKNTGRLVREATDLCFRRAEGGNLSTSVI